MSKKTILFHSYTLYRLEDLIHFSNYLRDEFEVIFLIPDESHIDLLEQHKIKYVCIHCNKTHNNNPYKIPNSNFLINNRYFTMLLQSIKQTSIGQILKESLFYNKCKRYAEISAEVLQKSNIDLVVTFSDGHSFELEIGLIKAAKELNIPIFLPFIANWNQEAHYSLIKDNPQYKLTDSSPIYQKYILKQHTYQVYKNRYFFPAYMFSALSRLNMLSKMPWLNGGGISDKVAMPNKLVSQEYIKMGIDENKLEILGDLSYISLYKTFVDKKDIKTQLVEKYGLKHDKIIIIGLANWLEHGLADEETHWQIVANTVESVLKFQDEYSILITLHPSMKLKNYVFLENRYNVKILQERLMNVLPAADIYVADQSSTIPWAIICGIKTLIVCYYKDLNYYRYFNSISYAKEADEITEKLELLISDEISFEHDWDLLSKDKIFHNHIVQDYIDLLNEMTKK